MQVTSSRSFGCRKVTAGFTRERPGVRVPSRPPACWPLTSRYVVSGLPCAIGVHLACILWQ